LSQQGKPQHVGWERRGKELEAAKKDQMERKEVEAGPELPGRESGSREALQGRQ
jgi:hypothetical protein